MVNGLVNTHPSSLKTRSNHIASCVAAQAAIYSASIVFNAVEICCFDCQLIGDAPIKNINPVTDLLVSMHLA